MSPKALKRFSVTAVVIGIVVLVDGLVLLFTNGLKTTATPILPELGGSFSKTRSSGASLVVLGVAIVVLALVGWWWLSRRKKDATEVADESGPVATDGAAPAAVSAPRHAATPSPSIGAETREPASPA